LKPENLPDPTALQQRGDELRAQISGDDPHILAWKTGAIFTPSTSGEGKFRLEVWKQETFLTFPELVALDATTGGGISPLIETLLLYYFSTADGHPLRGEWVSFADLPDGRFYNQAFQSYTGGELTRFFQSDRVRFENAAQRVGGEVLQDAPGDVAFRFQALPCVPLLLVHWQGDEDFPSSYQILFDASTSHYLPTDACAILGSYLTGRLKKSA